MRDCVIMTQSCADLCRLKNTYNSWNYTKKRAEIFSAIPKSFFCSNNTLTATKTQCRRRTYRRCMQRLYHGKTRWRTPVPHTKNMTGIILMR
jgi:hypothetical protein